MNCEPRLGSRWEQQALGAGRLVSLEASGQQWEQGAGVSRAIVRTSRWEAPLGQQRTVREAAGRRGHRGSSAGLEKPSWRPVGRGWRWEGCPEGLSRWKGWGGTRRAQVLVGGSGRRGGSTGEAAKDTEKEQRELG